MIFTSDHGDMLADHNLFRKAIPYQGSVSVPFIVYDPANNPDSEQGAVIDNIVELRDIMPTLLDMAGEEQYFD
jgi:arylsulfatase A-like enzyme